MVISSRRTYADAVSWIKHGEPEGFDRPGFALRVFGAFLATGIAGWGIGAYVSPESFGQPDIDVLRLGWPSTIYAGLVLAAAAALVLSLKRIFWVAARIREPYERSLAEHPSYEGAMNALAACARPLQIRFAVGWTWGPMIAVIAAALLTFSTAYLIVYAVLSSFDVGWQTYAIGAGDAALALSLLVAFAGRLSTWRVATSVYRSVILM